MRRLLVSLTTLLALACSDAVAPTRDLSDAHQRWLRTRPTDYRFTLAVSCFCFLPGPVVIDVHGDSVVARRVQSTGAPLDPRLAASYVTIDALFARIAQAIADRADHLTAAYDASRGYPTSIAIDAREGLADDEVQYTISAFEPR